MQTVRTLAAQGTESTPSAGAFYRLESGPAKFLEFMLTAGVAAGGWTSVVLAFWRYNEGFVAKLGTQTLTATDIAIPQPVIFDAFGDNVWVTVESFSGGAAQTLAGVVRVREVEGAVSKNAMRIDTAVLHADVDGLETLVGTTNTNTGPATSLTAEASKAANGATAVQLDSAVCTHGCWVCNPFDSGIIVGVGSSSSVTMAKSLQLAPGEKAFFRVSNANKLYIVSASGTPTVGVLPN